MKKGNATHARPCMRYSVSIYVVHHTVRYLRVCVTILSFYEQKNITIGAGEFFRPCSLHNRKGNT